jgi:hypothetical protein
MAQCLEHLIKSDAAYFVTLQQISDGRFKMNCWEKYTPFTRMFDHLMKKYFQEEVVRKLKAPGKISPAKSQLGLSIVDNYCDNLDSFLHHVSNCHQVDLKNIVITSPLSSRSNISFEGRIHIGISIRLLKSNPGFPMN